MSGRSERKRLPRRLVDGALLVLLGIASGFGVGRATRREAPPDKEMGASFLSDEAAKNELAACRGALNASAEISRTRPGNDAVPEGPEKTEALRRAVDECKIREALVEAHVCATARDHVDVMYATLDGPSCEDKAEVERYMEKSDDACAHFDPLPPYLDPEVLTEEEMQEVTAAARARAMSHSEAMKGWASRALRACRERSTL